MEALSLDSTEKAPENTGRPTHTPKGLSDVSLINQILSSECSEVFVLSTGKMLEVSKDSYPLPWMAREIGQNMSDHNPGINKGSINGVEIKEERNPDGSTTIEIIGHWLFEDSTGAIMNHSYKEGELGQESAGGNGVGLKQAALRFVRDYGVKFQIQGGDQNAGWQVSYRYLQAAVESSKFSTEAESKFLKHDYFCAALNSAPPTTCCKYIFTTNNDEVLNALRNLHKIMVCDHNPHLQDLDFKNEKGGIKWLAPDPTNNTPPKGNIFMNGQIYGYLNKGQNNEDYWQGPQGVTVQLNNIAHRRTMDRPPLSANEFREYSKQLLDSISADQLLVQLEKSEALWSRLEAKGRYDYDKPGWQVIVEGIIFNLKFAYPQPDGLPKYVQTWQEKRFVSATSRLSQEQIDELTRKGYSICPASFSDLGMPNASSALDLKVTEKKLATLNAHKIGEMAETSGVAVATAAIEVKDAYELMAWLKREVSPYIEHIGFSNDGIFRINFRNLSIQKEAMASLLYDPKGGELKALYAIRSFVLKALNEEWICSDRNDAPTTLFNGIRTSYSCFYDLVQGAQLLIRNEVVHGSENFLEFRLETAAKIDPDKLTKIESLGPTPKKQVVATDALDKIKTFSELLLQTKQLLFSTKDIISLSEDNHLFIDLGNIELSAIDPSFRYHPQDEKEKLIYNLRSFICCGLRRGFPSWIDSKESPQLLLNGIKSSCSLDQDGQLMLEQTSSKDPGSYIRLKLSDSAAQEAKILLKNTKMERAENKEKHVEDTSVRKESRQLITSWPSIAAGVALVSAAGAYFLSNPKSSAASRKNLQGISENSKSQPARPSSEPKNRPTLNSDPLIGKTLQNIESVVEESQRKTASSVKTEYDRWKANLKTAQARNDATGADTTRSVDALVSGRDKRDAIRVPYNSAEIENPEIAKLKAASSKLNSAMNAFAPNGHLIENFKIIDNLNPEYKRKLDLLAEYLSLTTGIKPETNLFIFQGSGAYGVNIERTSIGLHEELLKPLAPFTRALETFIHEIAHNASGSGHELEWRHAYATLAADAEAKIYQILSKHRRGLLLDQNEQKILLLRDSWHLKR